jgi:hypothetical protein
MARPMLPDIRRLEIEYEASGGGDGNVPRAEPSSPRAELGFPGAAPAALLGGWFADRLGWTFRSAEAKAGEMNAGEISATFDRGGDRLALSLRPREKLDGSAGGMDRPAGGIAAIRLSAADDAFIELDARTDAGILETHHRTPTVCVLPRRLPLPRPTEADLLGSALERVTHQGVLRGALEIAARLSV